MSFKLFLLAVFLWVPTSMHAWPPSCFTLPKSDHEIFLERVLDFSVDVNIELSEELIESCDIYGMPLSVWCDFPHLAPYILLDLINENDELDEYLMNFNEFEGKL